MGKLFDLRADPFERADITSNTYYDWMFDHAFLVVPSQTYIVKFIETFKEYANFAQIQYNGGYAPYATVLQAQQQLFPAELNYAQFRASLLASYVNIYKAMGGGWIIEAEKMTLPPDRDR